MSFGRSLQDERERLGVALDTVASATKVAVRHLEALEADNPRDLPGGVFNRGIVQSYCRCLGLDESHWLDRYTREHNEQEHDWAEFAEAVKRNRTSAGTSNSKRWLGVLLMLLGLAAMGWAAWHFVIRQRIGHPAPAIPQQAGGQAGNPRG